MNVYFSEPRGNAPEWIVAEGEIHFNADTPLRGMKLVGLTVKRSKDGEEYITFPGRPSANKGRDFEYLRSVDGPSEEGKQAYFGLKDWLMEQYRAWAGSRGSAPAPRESAPRSDRQPSNGRPSYGRGGRASF